jgi:putative endonuclease
MGESLFKPYNQILLYKTYILKSISHDTYYYGSTANINKRLEEHNAGKVRYTKGRRPWVLHYYEEFETRSDARKRERFYKTIEGYNYLKSKGII